MPTLQEKKDNLIFLALKWQEGESHEDEVSDMIFDELEQEILETDPTFNYRLFLEKAGTDEVHPINMDKVEKMQEKERSMDEVQASLQMDPNSEDSPKYDGGGLCLYYSEGLFTKALTRSSQKSGKNQTSKVATMVPLTLEDKDIVAIECEAICTWDKGHGELSRQAATGLLNSNSLQERCEDELTIIAFKVRYKDGVEKNWVEGTKALPQLKKGKNITFTPTPFNQGSYKGNVFTCKDFSALIDGIVEYKDGKSLAHKLYFNEKKNVKISKIEWNYTPSSMKYVPKYTFPTISVDGTNVSRASAGGTAELKHKKCGVGAEVEIIKAGLTIPQVLRPTSNVVEYDFTTEFMFEMLPFTKVLQENQVDYEVTEIDENGNPSDFGTLHVKFSTTHYDMVKYFNQFKGEVAGLIQRDKDHVANSLMPKFELPKKLKLVKGTLEYTNAVFSVYLGMRLKILSENSEFNTSEDFSIPTTCGCGTELNWSNELNGGLYCSNKSCQKNLETLKNQLIEKGVDLRTLITADPIVFVESYMKCPRFGGVDKLKFPNVILPFIMDLLSIDESSDLLSILKKHFNTSGLQDEVVDKVKDVVKLFMINEFTGVQY